MKIEKVASEWKAVHWAEQIEAWRSGELVYPRLLQIDPVAACNHNCGFCTYRYRKDTDMNALFNESDMISYGDFVSVLSDSVDMGIKGVEFTGGGEPTLHPRFADMLELTAKKGLDIGLITNGVGQSFVNERDRLVYLLSHARWVRFSVNGSNPNDYQIVHESKSNDFWAVCDSILSLTSVPDRTVTVGISFIVQRENYQGIRDMVHHAHQLGADYLRVAPAVFGTGTVADKLHDVSDYYDEGIRQSVESDLAWAKSESDVTIVDNFTGRLRAKDSPDVYEKDDFCYISCVMAVVGADMKLYTCCVFKYRPAGMIGSLKPRGLKHLWESVQREGYYAGMDISEMCVSCFMKPKNDFIAYVVDPEPLHINFI